MKQKKRQAFAARLKSKIGLKGWQSRAYFEFANEFLLNMEIFPHRFEHFVDTRDAIGAKYLFHEEEPRGELLINAAFIS